MRAFMLIGFRVKLNKIVYVRNLLIDIYFNTNMNYKLLIGNHYIFNV